MKPEARFPADGRAGDRPPSIAASNPCPPPRSPWPSGGLLAVMCLLPLSPASAAPGPAAHRASPGPVVSGAAPADTAPAFVGRVESSVNQRPLVAAVVLVGEGPDRKRVIADSTGRFRLPSVPPGPVSVEIRYLGFAPVDTSVRVPGDGGTARYVFQLPVRPVELPDLPVAVEGEEPRPVSKLSGFYRRMEAGYGTYFTRDEIRNSPGSDLHWVFKGVPGIETEGCQTGNFRQPCRVVSTRTVGSSYGRLCDVTYYMDGVPFPNAAGLDAIPRHNIVAIEVYSGGSETPPEFKGRGGNCGVVVLWTIEPGRRHGSGR